MAWSKKSSGNIKKNQVILAVILLIVLLVVAFLFWRYVYSQNEQVETDEINPPIQTQQPNVNDSADEAPRYDATKIQATVDDWVNSTNGTSSVVIMEPEGQIIAAHNADQVYFAASLYKLYVAYEGYRLIDEIDEDPNSLYLDNYTRTECLDKMIRESHSPCAEKMWTELGKLELTNKLREYGITNTSMVSISTTARDAALILSRISRGEGLNEDAQVAYLDSMKTQEDIYRRGLPSGFSDNITVYNKVGWNELVEWHDASIIELAEEERLIITVLTENVGTAKIRELASSLESVLSN